MGPNTAKLFYRIYWTMFVVYITIIGSSYYNATGEPSFTRECGKPLTDTCKSKLNILAFDEQSMQHFDIMTTVIVVLTLIALYQWYTELKEMYRQSIKKYKNKRNRAKAKREE